MENILKARIVATAEILKFAEGQDPAVDEPFEVVTCELPKEVAEQLFFNAVM